MEQLGAISPAFNQMREIAGAVTGDARTAGMRRGYTEDTPTTGERVRAATGLRPLARSLDADVRDGQREATDDRKKAMDRYIARMVQARRAGIVMAPASIRRALRDAEVDRGTRDIRRAPRESRHRWRLQIGQDAAARGLILGLGEHTTRAEILQLPKALFDPTARGLRR